MSSDASSAFFSLTQAEYAAGNFKQKVAEGSMTARIRVGAGVDNVAGVKLPVFTKYETGAVADNQSLGLVGGGKKIVAVREKFTVLLEMLIRYDDDDDDDWLLVCWLPVDVDTHILSLFRLASLQTSFATLDEALKVTNRRVNALENVTIPKIEGILSYIARELDELEREGTCRYCLLLWRSRRLLTRLQYIVIHSIDFTRLKIVKGKKEEQIKLEEKEKEAARLAGEKEISKPIDKDITAEFDATDDEDVVF